MDYEKDIQKLRHALWRYFDKSFVEDMGKSLIDDTIRLYFQRVASRQREIDAKKAALAGELAKKEIETPSNYRDGVVDASRNITDAIRNIRQIEGE